MMEHRKHHSFAAALAFVVIVSSNILALFSRVHSTDVVLAIVTSQSYRTKNVASVLRVALSVGRSTDRKTQTIR